METFYEEADLVDILTWKNSRNINLISSSKFIATKQKYIPTRYFLELKIKIHCQFSLSSNSQYRS
jgi:hypothetical protein